MRQRTELLNRTSPHFSIFYKHVAQDRDARAGTDTHCLHRKRCRHTNLLMQYGCKICMMLALQEYQKRGKALSAVSASRRSGSVSAHVPFSLVLYTRTKTVVCRSLAYFGSTTIVPLLQEQTSGTNGSFSLIYKPLGGGA